MIKKTKGENHRTCDSDRGRKGQRTTMFSQGKGRKKEKAKRRIERSYGEGFSCCLWVVVQQPHPLSVLRLHRVGRPLIILDIPCGRHVRREERREEEEEGGGGGGIEKEKGTVRGREGKKGGLI